MSNFYRIFFQITVAYLFIFHVAAVLNLSCINSGKLTLCPMAEWRNMYVESCYPEIPFTVHSPQDLSNLIQLMMSNFDATSTTLIGLYRVNCYSNAVVWSTGEIGYLGLSETNANNICNFKVNDGLVLALTQSFWSLDKSQILSDNKYFLCSFNNTVTSNVEGWVEIIPGVVLYNTTKSYKDAASNCSVAGKILDGISVLKIPPLKIANGLKICLGNGHVTQVSFWLSGGVAGIFDLNPAVNATWMPITSITANDSNLHFACSANSTQSLLSPGYFNCCAKDGLNLADNSTITYYNIDVQLCIEACRSSGKTLALLEPSQCHCYSALSSDMEVHCGELNECRNSCRSNPLQNCGGNNSLAIYSTMINRSQSESCLEYFEQGFKFPFNLPIPVLSKSNRTLNCMMKNLSTETGSNSTQICNRISVMFNGRCYTFVKMLLNATASQRICARIGGSLLIPTEETINFVQKYAQEMWQHWIFAWHVFNNNSILNTTTADQTGLVSIETPIQNIDVANGLTGDFNLIKIGLLGRQKPSSETSPSLADVNILPSQPQNLEMSTWCPVLVMANNSATVTLQSTECNATLPFICETRSGKVIFIDKRE